MNRKAIIGAALSLALCTGMGVSAGAANNTARSMGDSSRRAVAAAISAGKIPADATIYDCSFSAGADGVTVVVDYRDKNGVWIDVATGRPSENPPEAPDAPGGYRTVQMPTEDELAEYADTVYKLVNEAREDAGLYPLERSEYLEEPARLNAPP